MILVVATFGDDSCQTTRYVSPVKATAAGRDNIARDEVETRTRGPNPDSLARAAKTSLALSPSVSIQTASECARAGDTCHWLLVEIVKRSPAVRVAVGSSSTPDTSVSPLLLSSHAATTFRPLNVAMASVAVPSLVRTAPGCTSVPSRNGSVITAEELPWP